ncbi:hypothetical protein [Longispora albida]|uniref:hypothetical protein n=1 Tax=Longispora albida TaxID=203523 RepID=UPI000377D646|nr:hypothetical protein [Longispora albida]
MANTVSALLWLAWAVTPVLLFYGWVSGNSLFESLGTSVSGTHRATSHALYTAAWVTGIGAPAAGLVLGLFCLPRRQTYAFAFALAVSAGIALCGWSATRADDPAAPSGPSGCAVHSGGGSATCGGG